MTKAITPCCPSPQAVSIREREPAVVIPFRAKKAYSEARAEKILTSTWEADLPSPGSHRRERPETNPPFISGLGLSLVCALGRSLGEALKSVPDLPSGIEKYRVRKGIYQGS